MPEGCAACHCIASVSIVADEETRLGLLYVFGVHAGLYRVRLTAAGELGLCPAHAALFQQCAAERARLEAMDRAKASDRSDEPR